MTNTNNLMPFNIVFLDEPLPKCFGQHQGMTFKDLLTVIGREFRNTYAQGARASCKKKEISNKDINTARKDIFNRINEELGDAEYERFLSVFYDLEKETDYQALKSSAYIGNSLNARNHMGANNLLEWMFSADGRIDACFIQKEGVKFIFIMDVRLSNHYNKKDTQLHEQNRDIAKVIADSFDGKNGNDPKGLLKNGLLAYQHELLQNTNTAVAQFETLLITIEQLIASSDSVQEKIDSFKRDFSACLSHVDQKEFDEYIKKRLNTGPIKRYQKELFEKLYHYEYGHDHLTNDISNAFSGIQLVKTTAPSLFNRALDLIEKDDDEKSEREWAQETLDCFRVYHKLPRAFVYVLEEMLEDVCSDIEEDETKNKLTYFILALKELKEKYHLENGSTPLNLFKTILQYVKKSRFSALEDMFKEDNNIKESKNVLQEMLNMDASDMNRPESIDKIAKAFIKMIVDEEYSSVSDFVNENRSLIHKKDKNSLYRKIKNPDDTFVSLFNELFKNEKIKEKVCQQYPYLAEHIHKLQKESSLSYLDEINTICEYYAEFTQSGDEDFFVEANNVLKKMSPNERALLKGYVRYVYNQSDISELLMGSMDIIREFVEIEKLKEIEKNKEQMASIAKKENEAALRIANRVAFENLFNEFLTDMGSDDIYEELQTKAKELTQEDLIEMKRLPSELGEFAGDYLKYRSQKKKPAFSTLIEKVLAREAQKRRMKFNQVLDNYFDSLDRQTARKDLEFACLSIEASDVENLLTVWRKHEEQNKLKILFLETYQKTSFDVARKKMDNYIIKEKRKVYDQFEEKYAQVVENHQEENVSDFVGFLTKISNVDLDMLLYMMEQNENAPAYRLLDAVKKIRSKNSKNMRNEIQETVLSTKRRVELVKYIHNCLGPRRNPTQDNKEGLVQAIIRADRSDINAFFSENSNNAPFHLFFAELKKLKNKSNPKNLESRIMLLIESASRRMNFYDSFFAFMREDDVQRDKAEELVEAYFKLTPQDKKDIEVEQPMDELVFPVLLARLGQIEKEKGDKENLISFLEKNRWETEFYIIFDGLSREDGVIKKQNDIRLFEAAVSSLSFEQAYSILSLKGVKKPRCLSLSLKNKCFFDAFDRILHDRKDTEAQKFLKDICVMCTIPDLKEIASKEEDPSVLCFMIRLVKALKSSSSLLEKESAIHRAIDALVRGGKENDLLGMNGIGMPLRIKKPNANDDLDLF